MLRVRDNNVGLLGKRSPDSSLVYLLFLLGTRVMFICSIFERDIGYMKGGSFLFWKLASYCYYDELFRIYQTISVECNTREVVFNFNLRDYNS